MQAAAVDPERPRRLLEEVLSRSEFQGSAPQMPDPLSRLIQRLLGAFGPAPEWLGDVITLLILIAAVAFVVRVLAEGGLPRRRRRGRDPGADTGAEAARVPAAELYRAGCEALRAGSPGEAVTLLFRAMIARLTERDLLLDDPSRTDREHLRDLRTRPGEAAVLAAALPSFERVRYGRRPVAEDEAREVQIAAGALFPEQSP